MKRQDAFLFSLPFTAALLLVVFGWFLYRQISGFEESYTAEARENIAREAKLASAVITPLLEAGDELAAVRFCEQSDPLRLTLIAASGEVLADSSEKAGILGNHLDREEVRAALAGTPSGTVRYSESLGQWMIYYAAKLDTGRGTYILRSAVSTDRMSRLIAFARLNMFWALLFGGQIVLLLAVYIVTKVRRPLVALERSVGDLSAGNLDSRIEIPGDGVIRDLALGVSAMAERLKQELANITAERNEKDALLETMSEAVLLFAANGELLRSNQAATQLFGISGEPGRFQLSRCGIPDLLSLAHRTFRSGESFEKEFLLRQNGVPRSLFIKGRILEDGAIKRLLLTVTELTSLRKLESFRGEFIANVSHEVKTPLTCIIGAVEVLEEEKELTETQQKELLAILKQQSTRLNNLVRDILSLAELEKRQADSARDFKLLPLDSLLINAADLCGERAAAAGIELAITESTPLQMEGDECLLEQAVINLIENAIKYSGGKHITLSLRQDGKNAVIEVRDDGVGIPPAERERIFERFYRLDKSRSRELGGTGLGLAIVKHAVQLHKGHAEATEPEGPGALFRITLPLESNIVGVREGASPLP